MNFDQLDEAGKNYARQQYVEQPGYPFEEWWAFDDFVECARLLGIQIDPKDIHFSGFWSQGDGASFTGTYKCEPQAVELIAAHAPLDETLKSLAARLTALQTGVALSFGGTLVARIVQSSSMYCHSNTMQCSVWRMKDNEFWDALEHEEKELTDILRRFADWIYKDLEQQYDSYFENDYIDQCLEDMSFHADGSII